MMPVHPTAPRRGRPPALEQKATVSTWLESRLHDRLVRLAAREQVSVSRLVRQLLVIQLHDDRP